MSCGTSRRAERARDGAANVAACVSERATRSQYIREILGPCAISAPAVDIGANVFSKIVNAAFGTPDGTLHLDPSSGDIQFLSAPACRIPRPSGPFNSRATPLPRSTVSSFIFTGVCVQPSAWHGADCNRCPPSSQTWARRVAPRRATHASPGAQFIPSIADAPPRHLLSSQTAYNGGAGQLVSFPAINSATSLLAAEAFHVGATRAALLLLSGRDAGVGGGHTVAQVVDAISGLRAKLGGGNDVGLTVAARDSVQAGLVGEGETVGVTAPVSPLSGLAYSRSASEVGRAACMWGGGGKGDPCQRRLTLGA